MKILCKIFGHRIKHGTLNTYRMNASCSWCDKKLKVSYDMSYGATIVVGDYGNQQTFCWCHCGNELCSSNSFLEDTDLVRYKCSTCGLTTEWDFDAPAPILIKSFKD